MTTDGDFVIDIFRLYIGCKFIYENMEKKNTGFEWREND